MPLPELLCGALVAGITLIAAITDYRTGHMPNWLTLSPLALAPLIHGVASGLPGALLSLAGAALCGLVPWLLYRASGGDAIGGGDLKLFAAIGALTGPLLGLEIQLLSFVLVAVVALARLSFHGQLLGVLLNALFLLANPFLPQRWRRTIRPEALTALRMGPFIAASALALLAYDSWQGGMP